MYPRFSLFFGRLTTLVFVFVVVVGAVAIVVGFADELLLFCCLKEAVESSYPTKISH